MFKSIYRLFSPKEPAPSRGATIMLTCGILMPNAYYGAGRIIEKMGLHGVMQMTKEGKIQLDLEGDYTVIEKLERDLKSQELFGPRCKDELMWLPFGSKYYAFTIRPLFEGHPPEADLPKL